MNQKVVLITGADHGICLAITEELLANGHRVAGIDLSGDHLIPLQISYPDQLRYYPCNVTKREGLR